MAEEVMPPELADLHPNPDPTGGRSYADAGAPTRWTQVATQLGQRLKRRMATLDAYVQENQAFDKVKLTEPEEVLGLALKSTSEWEEAVRLYGSERVAGMRRKLQEGLVKYPEVTQMVAQGLQQGGQSAGPPTVG